jgi:hypothetical protein
MAPACLAAAYNDNRQWVVSCQLRIESAAGRFSLLGRRFFAKFCHIVSEMIKTLRSHARGTKRVANCIYGGSPN